MASDLRNSSREAAIECSPRSKPWGGWENEQALKGRKRTYDTGTSRILTLTAYSNGSGCKLKSFSPAAFFSAYFFIPASQLLPAAVSRPVNASAPISAYDTVIFSFEFFG